MKDKEKVITDHIKSVVLGETVRPTFPEDRREPSIGKRIRLYDSEQVDAILTDVLTQILEGKIELTNTLAIDAFVKNYKK